MNFIETIEIKNFKSIRHQKIEGCKRINVFVGPPNVGKSNILEALGLYSVTQQVNSERFPLNSICRYNHYSDLYFDKNLQNRIEIILNEEHTLSFSKKNNSTSEFEIFIQTKGILEHSVFNTIVGEYNNFKINSVPAEDDLRNSEIYKVKYYHFEKANFINKIKSLSLSIPNGDNLLDILHGNSDLRKAYSELLNIYGLKLNISDSEIAIAKELTDGTFVSFPNNLISDTLRRLFFYIAAIQTNENSVLLFEEPEANMFPPYISKFTADIMYDDNNNQYFIATHSPFVINDLMENLKKDDYAIYTVGYGKDTGETLIRRMTDEELHDIYQYGVDLFLNIENFLPNEQQQ